MLHFCSCIDNKETKIRGDEFVAAAACVELPAERAKFFDEGFFDEVMNVFGICAKRIDPCGVGSRAIGDFVERREGLLHLSGCENADGFERFGPGAVDGDFVRQKAAIECKGTLERVEVSIWLTLEATTPQPVIFAIGHLSFSNATSTSRARGRQFLCRGAACCAPTSRICLMVAAFGFSFGTHSNRQSEKVDEAFGVLGVVAAHGEAGKVRAIEGERRDALGDGQRAFPEFQADRSGYSLLRNVEETVERGAQRRKPQAIVNELGVAKRERLLKVGRLAVDGERFELTMRGHK